MGAYGFNRGVFQGGGIPDPEAVPRENKSLWLLRGLPSGEPEGGNRRGVHSLANNVPGRLRYATSAYPECPGDCRPPVRVAGCWLYASPTHHSAPSLPQITVFEILRIHRNL